MYYYLLTEGVPVASQHKKNVGEKHYRDIEWSTIKLELTHEQYLVASQLSEDISKGGKTDLQTKQLDRVLGMTIVTDIMVAALNRKQNKPKAKAVARVQQRHEEDWEGKEVDLGLGRSEEEERTRLLHINTRAILEGNKVAPLAESPKEFAQQIRKAMEMRSAAGLELMLRAAERGIHQTEKEGYEMYPGNMGSEESAPR